jgi:diguanylate cyclase (GGDEF)-like protein
MERASERPLRLLLVDDDPEEASRIEDLVRMAVPGPTEVYRLAWPGEVRHGPVGRDGDCILLRAQGPPERVMAEVARLVEELPEVAMVALVGRGEEAVGLEAVAHGAQDYLVREEVAAPLLARTILTAVERRRHRQLDLQDSQFRDLLTGLPGPALLHDRLNLALARLRRREGAVAVLCIDLDRFVSVVEQHGEEMGDRLLSSVAARLLKIFRVEDTVARFGRDRFLAVCEDVLDEQAVVGIGERVAEALREPFSVGGRELSVSAAVGACVVQEPSDDPDDVIRDAEAAMLRAKRRGRERPERGAKVLGPAVVQDGATFLRAVEDLEFRLFHQPIVSLTSGQVQGSEVLLRWEHPSRGLLGPEEFMPAAEAAGVLKRIGEWVLTEACSQAVVIQAACGPDRPLPVTVNLAPEQVTSLETVDRVLAALSAAKLEPDLLGMEVTELALREEPEAAARVVEGLRDLGVRLVLDDFGLTGTSSESIERFGVQLVKLDRTVVQGLGGARKDAASQARELVDRVHAFQIPVLAEAVETEEEAEALRELGCDLAQGYLFGRPQPLEAFLTLLDDGSGAKGRGKGEPPASEDDATGNGARGRGVRRRRRAKRS